MARPILHHRTDEFRAIFKECTAGLKTFLKTTDDVLILACSGSGAMEASLVNVLSTGESMLALVAGNFGQRWADIGRAHGMDVHVLEAPWGDAVPPAAVAEALDRDPKIRAVFVQLSESSTGARHDIQGLAEVVRKRPDTLLVVDAISGAGAMALETAAWGVDVVVVGSQKALALPPGLAFLSVSAEGLARGWTSPRHRASTSTCSRERKAQAGGESAFTPAITLMVGLKAALDFVGSIGGVDALVKNAGTLATMTRELRRRRLAPARGAKGPRRRPDGALSAGRDRVGGHRQGPQVRVRVDRGRRTGAAQGEDLPDRPPRLLRRHRHPRACSRPWRSPSIVSATSSTSAAGWPPPRRNT